MSSAFLQAFVHQIEAEQLGVHAAIVTQSGDTLGKHHWVAEKPHHMRSLSKSFASCAVGIAVDEGRLALDDKAVDFFPNIQSNSMDERIRNLTVRHLLTMAHGRDESIMLSTQRDHIADPDWVRYFLSMPLDRNPGERFVYDTGATYMLSAILQEITGKTLRDYCVDRLFRPLDIDNPHWETCPQGRTLGGSGLSITVSAVSRFGNMLLNLGQWDGRQLVPAAYISEATAKQIETGDAGAGPDWHLGYGYQFWMCPHGAYRGDGAEGQFCIVLPDEEAVIAITSEESRMQDILNVVWATILPQL